MFSSKEKRCPRRPWARCSQQPGKRDLKRSEQSRKWAAVSSGVRDHSTRSRDPVSGVQLWPRWRPLSKTKISLEPSAAADRLAQFTRRQYRVLYIFMARFNYANRVLSLFICTFISCRSHRLIRAIISRVFFSCCIWRVSLALRKFFNVLIHFFFSSLDETVFAQPIKV